MRTFIPLMIGATLVSAPACAQTSEEAVGVIHVTATASANVSPDTATISAGVQSQAKTAQQAMAENSAQMQKVYSALTERGVDLSDVSTSSLNLSPRYNYEVRREGQPQLVGYQASNQIMVRTEDLDSVGTTIDALIAAGLNTINNVAFSVKDTDAAMAKARTDAIAKAQDKAASMASAANVELGRLLSLSEGAAPVRYQPMMASDMVARESLNAAPPLSPGEREISATVTLTYAIAD